MDKTVRQLSSHISKKVSDSLSSLCRDDKEKFITCWHDVSLVIKLGVLEDEKFYDRVKDILIWKNTTGEWTTAPEYLEHNREKTKDKILYTRDPSHAIHVLDVYRQRGIEVLCAESPIDQYVMQFLEKKLTPATFQRIDAAIDDTLLDKEKEKTIIDASGKTEASHLADFIRSKLNDASIAVEAKSLASESLPGFVIIDENQRRTRDYLMQADPNQEMGLLHKMTQRTFVVNTNNPLMETIQKLDHIDADLAQDLVKQSFELSLLSQREMDPTALNEFVQRNNRILEKFAKIASKTVLQENA
jgi:molecular chaperone HtpG